MSGDRELILTDYIKKILQGENEEMMVHLAKYGNRFTRIVQTMQINEENFSGSLEGIANELFTSRNASYPYIAALCVFCLKLDAFCKCTHSWYQTDILIQSLVNILTKTSFNPPYNTYILLYMLIFLYYTPGSL